MTTTTTEIACNENAIDTFTAKHDHCGRQHCEACERWLASPLYLRPVEPAHPLIPLEKMLLRFGADLCEFGLDSNGDPDPAVIDAELRPALNELIGAVYNLGFAIQGRRHRALAEGK